MRIIAGKWRSRRLDRPANNLTRPMPDRVKEAVFDILGSYYHSPGALPSLAVADVFAGSGSLGLEALSRGARSCCFFERDRSAMDALQKNLASLDVGGAATVVTGDAWRSVATRAVDTRFDLVFLDPPYRDSRNNSKDGAVHRCLAAIGTVELPQPLIVLHHEACVSYECFPGDAWRVLTARTYGSNGITCFLR